MPPNDALDTESGKINTRNNIVPVGPHVIADVRVSVDSQTDAGVVDVVAELDKVHKVGY